MNHFVEIVVSCINAILMVYVLKLFFSSIANRKYTSFIHYVLLWIIIAIHTVILCTVTNKILNITLFVLLAYVASLLYNLKWYGRILFVLTITAISSIAELITNFLFISIYSVDFQATMSGAFYILGILLSKTILLFIILFIRTKVKKALYANSPKKIITILLIPLSSIMMMLLVYYCVMQLESTNDTLVWGVLIC